MTTTTRPLALSRLRLPSLALLALLSALSSLVGCGGGAAEQREETIEDPDPLTTVSAERLYEMGVELARRGDFIRAEHYLAASIERGYSADRAIPLLIDVCVRGSRLAAALRYADPYLEQHPERWPLRLLVASIRFGMDEPEAARADLVRVLRDAPEEPPQAHYLLGVIYRDALSNVERARDHFRRYLAVAPSGPHAEEARSSLPPEDGGPPLRIESAPREGGGPVRIPASEVPEETPQQTEGQETEGGQG